MTSTTDTADHKSASSEISSSSNNEMDKQAASKRVITGREILTQYFKGDAVALITYRKICNALEILPKWEAPAKIQFLEQFLNISDMLDNRCTQLVINLSRLNWQVIPEQIMERYLSMLCDVAIRQVSHTETIYTSLVSNLIPVVKVDEEGGDTVLALTAEEQDKFYGMAHRTIAHILQCFPMSNKVLLKALRLGVPHQSHDSLRFVGYMRNMIQCLEYVGDKLRANIWELIIDQMIVCDTVLTKSEYRDDKKSADDTTIFDMDEDQEQEAETDESDKIAKLDGVMRDLLCYTALKHNVSTDALPDTSWLRLCSGTSGEEVFSILMSLLESRMLLAVHVRYTSFLWLYICSLEEKYASRTLECLWSVVVRPQVAQADVAKAHGAAAYIAAFLARAKYLDIQVAMSWLSRIVNWCIQYVDNCGMTNKTTSPGVMRHGTFYALCQAFFIIFSFRYKEMVRSGDIDEVARWGLGRILHSPLDPLKYVIRPVGLCFAAISRSLQLVYCNHLLPFDAGTKLPFEPMFPFDTFKLRSSMVLVCAQLRRFSPLAEDKSEVTSALKNSRISETGNEDALDFLEEEDVYMGSYADRGAEAAPCGGNQPSMFTIYSTSPGLRQFENSMNMSYY